MPILSQPRLSYLDPDGVAYPGALLSFYESGTSTPVVVYQDALYQTPHPATITQLSDGYFPLIYLRDDGGDFKAIFTDEDGGNSKTIDPISSSIDFDYLAEGLNGVTAAEELAGVTPTSFDYKVGDPRRYGVVADGTDQYSKLKNALDVLEAQGGGKLIIPVMGGGVIGITETLQPYDNITIEWEGVTWLKLLSDTTYDSAITPQPGARNVKILYPMIDCNGIPAGCGLIARRNNTDMEVVGGVIKNAAHDE